MIALESTIAHLLLSAVLLFYLHTYVVLDDNNAYIYSLILRSSSIAIILLITLFFKAAFFDIMPEPANVASPLGYCCFHAVLHSPLNSRHLSEYQPVCTA